MNTKKDTIIFRKFSNTQIIKLHLKKVVVNMANIKSLPIMEYH